MTQGGDGYSWRVGKKETAVNANAVGKSRALRQKKGGGDWWGKEYVLRRQLNDGYKEED